MAATAEAPPVEPTVPEHDGLLSALLAVQSEAPTLPKDGVNPHFKSKYTPLDTIVERIGPILAKHGLVWTTLPCRDDQGDPALRYRLAHASSSQTLEGVMPLLLVKADPQGMGSAITYARRYSLCAVLNLVADEDDDGNAGSQQTNGKANGQTSAKKPKRITDKQASELVDAAEAAAIPADKLLLAASHVSGDEIKNVASLRLLTVEQAGKVSEWIIKKAGEAA